VDQLHSLLCLVFVQEKLVALRDVLGRNHQLIFMGVV
jgi:hypothetical protein